MIAAPNLHNIHYSWTDKDPRQLTLSRNLVRVNTHTRSPKMIGVVSVNDRGVPKTFQATALHTDSLTLYAGD